jgi:CheY-like chemotaxis protein
MPQGGLLTIESFNLDLGEEIAATNSELQAGRYAVIAIRDTGCGMDDGVLRQAFEPFFTTKDQGKGTGLGLATVHGIVRQSGGYITVSSVVGQGTAFHIYLPAVDGHPGGPRLREATADPLRGAETILVAEDKEDVREYTREALEMYGYRVLLARNGVEALEIEHSFENCIDLLITDMIMPEMDGGELVRQMCQRRPNVKAIYASGYVDTSSASNGMMRLGTSFLQKPFTPKVLAAKVREVLAGIITT